MWTIAAVNKKFDGPLGSYNGLTDVHLAHYFSRPSRRSHLKAAKLRTFRKKSSKVASELFSEHPISSMVSFENGLARTFVKHFNSNQKNVKPSTAPGTCLCFTNENQHKVANLKRSLSAKLHSPYGTPLLLSGLYKEQSHFAFDHDKTSKHKKRKWRKGINSIGNSNNLKKKNLAENRMISVSIPVQTLKFSQCQITMLYHGHLHLSNFQKTLTQNILIKQQHCGGTPVVIYKGRISPSEMISFFSLDHEGFFFSIIVFLNGIRELKLSSCCVFRYPPGRRLGGTNGTFSIKKIEGGKPCLKCQYQEFENNNFKIASQISDSPIISPRKETLDAVISADLEDKDKINDKIAVDVSEAEESLRVNDIPNVDDAPSEHDVESIKMTSAEHNGDDDIEEILDDLPNDNAKKSVSSDEVGEETNGSSGEEDEIKESYDEEIKEQDESNHSAASSSNQSEVSEHFIEEPKKYHEISIGSSSEEEGEKQHVITVSIHESPEDS